MLPLCLFDVLQTGMNTLGVFVVVAAAVPFILPVFVVLLLMFYYFRWAHCGRVLCGLWLCGVMGASCAWALWAVVVWGDGGCLAAAVHVLLACIGCV
jgi:hypothetical protein